MDKVDICVRCGCKFRSESPDKCVTCGGVEKRQEKVIKPNPVPQKPKTEAAA